MVYAVETTETFETVFKKKHRDKVEWLKKIKEKTKRASRIRKATTRKITWHVADKNRSI